MKAQLSFTGFQREELCNKHIYCICQSQALLFSKVVYPQLVLSQVLPFMLMRACKPFKNNVISPCCNVWSDISYLICGLFKHHIHLERGWISMGLKWQSTTKWNTFCKHSYPFLYDSTWSSCWVLLELYYHRNM